MRPCAVLLAPAVILGAQSPLTRHYREGEVLVYRMKAVYEEDGRTNRTEATSTHTVRKGPDGVLEESIQWSNYIRDGKPATLPEAARAFRQVLSRSPGRIPALPDLKGMPQLEGPALDLLTFYADLFVSQMLLQKPGDRRTLPCPQANPFGSGPDLVLAEQTFDWDLTFQGLEDGVARILARHVPPKAARVRLPGAWMRPAEGAEPSNWVQIRRLKDGRTLAEIGRETFDVHLAVDAKDGRLLRATMDNPVDILARTCEGADFRPIEPGRRYRIHRKIEVALVR